MHTLNECERAAERAKPLAMRLKLGYSLGQMMDSVVAHSLGVFLLFYLTTVCGLPGALAGFALAAGMVIDAMLDPAIGSMSDSWKSRLGRRLPFMIVGIPLVMVLFVLIFSLPKGLPVWPLFAGVLVLSVLLRVSLSIFNVPYQALIAELTEDYAERSSIAAWRWALSMAGVLATLVLSFTVFFNGPTGTSDPAAYTPFALTVALVVGLGGLASIWSVAQVRSRLHLPADVHARLHHRVVSELREAARNRSFLVLIGSALLFFTALGAHSALALHINTFFWKLDPSQVKMATLSTFAGLVVGAPLAGPFLKRFEKRTVVMIGMSGLAAAGCLPALLRLVGLFPFEGAQLAIILTVTLFTGGVLMASAAIAYAAMIADATDEHEHRFGARREGLYYAGWAFAAKSAGGLGSLVAGLALQFSGMPAKPDAATLTAMGDSPLITLALLYALVSGLFYLGAISILYPYRLDAARHRTIIADLNQRRAAMAMAAVPTA